jgi:hypothetical protein
VIFVRSFASKKKRSPDIDIGKTYCLKIIGKKYWWLCNLKITAQDLMGEQNYICKEYVNFELAILDKY